METRAHHVWVGAVTLALLAALAAFIIWIARLNDGQQKEYDIFFRQSVGGLAKGSKVSFAGVPVGTIEVIELWPKDPSFVRVRINVEKQVPILVGTSAAIQTGFTGVSDIQLDGAVKGAPPIVERGPEGVPVIPARRSGLGEILNSAPVLLERLATLSERLNIMLSDENQASLKGILANTDKLTGNLADASPQVKSSLAELQLTLRAATTTLDKIDQTAGSASKLINEEGGNITKELRTTLQTANTAAAELQSTLNDARPAARQLSSSTLPAAEAALRDLRAASRSLRNVTDKIDEQGAGALVGGSNLPDYKP